MAIQAPPLFGDVDGFGGTGFDADGYDRNGYDSNGLNRDGFDVDGYDADGFDVDGYDTDGYDSDGYNSDDEDRNGELRKIDAGDLELDDLWRQFLNQPRSGSRFVPPQAKFRTYLRTLVLDPEDIDDVVFCHYCGIPVWSDDTVAVEGNDDTRVCHSCADAHFTECDNCEELHPDDDVYGTLNSQEVCLACREENYTYCDTCEGYYPDEDSDEHHHVTGGCCVSPQPKFTIRNDGCEPLADDVQTAIELPAGTISGVGLKAIRDYLIQQSGQWYRASTTGEDHIRSNQLSNIAYDLEPLGDQWQAKTGNFAKRLSSQAYKRYKLKLPPEILSQVGCLARDHSNAVRVTIAATRDLNLSARDFYHEDSCWWGGYSYSRCTLKTNGGFGLRSFTRSGMITGRVWVMPLRKTSRRNLMPTFDTMTPDAFVVFNGYGELAGYAAPRLLSHMAGWTYRKIAFTCEPMYVNNLGGYIVAPEDIARQYAADGVQLDLNKHASLFDDELAELAEQAAKTVTVTTEKETSDAVALRSRRYA